MNPGFKLCILYLFFTATGLSQQRPGLLDKQPGSPPPGRIEVRFAIGKEALECHRFYVKVESANSVIVKGKYSLGFQIPTIARDLPSEDDLDIRISCGSHMWHFRNANNRIFLTGWWWVGTDYPPFQWTLQNDAYKEALWIEYFIVDPSEDSGFYLYHECPKSLSSKKPGPCFPE
jgi:hypothetical protein